MPITPSAESTKRVKDLAVDRRQAIVGAAMRLFAERGFDGTTTKAIAKEAGVAEGTIYTYFHSKRDILLAFAEEVALESLRRTFDRMQGRADEKVLTAFIENRLRLMEEYGPAIKALIGQALFDSQVAESVRTRIALPAVEVLKGYIERRVRERGFKKIDPDAVAKAFVAQCLGLVVVHSIFSEESDTYKTSGDLAQVLAHLFLKGISR
ncbi:MAG: TetR/AcrR family transcriptional regulator [Armatimonadota bacterium]